MRPTIMTLCVSLLVVTATAAAQHDSTLRYHYEPWPLDVGGDVVTLGLSLSMLPEPVVENEVPAPALDLQYRRGIAPDVSLVATLSTNVVTSVVQAGVQWNDHAGSLSYAAGANLVGFYGWLSIEGQFDDNWAVAVAGLPFLRAGWRFEEFSLSSTLAASLVMLGQSHVGSLRSAGPTSPLNDVFMTLAVEQPFLERSTVSMGISLTYSRTPYQSWILFNTLDQFLLIPELFVGVQL